MPTGLLDKRIHLPRHRTHRILIDISPDARIVIAVPVVVQPGLLCRVLPRQPDALLDVVWVELLLDVAPGSSLAAQTMFCCSSVRAMGVPR